MLRNISRNISKIHRKKKDRREMSDVPRICKVVKSDIMLFLAFRSSFIKCTQLVEINRRTWEVSQSEVSEGRNCYLLSAALSVDSSHSSLPDKASQHAHLCSTALPPVQGFRASSDIKGIASPQAFSNYLLAGMAMFCLAKVTSVAGYTSN